MRRATERGALTSKGLCVAEGFHLLGEALRSGSEIVHVLMMDSVGERVEEMLASSDSDVAAGTMPEQIFRTIASTETSQGVLALVRPPVFQPASLFSRNSLVVVLDRLQDPGNAGTIMRTAEAFGASGIILVKGTVSPWNPKTLRSSAGSAFRIPLLTGLDESEVFPLLREHEVPLYAAMPRAGRAVGEIDFTGPAALVVGSEGSGVSEGFRERAEGFSIPTAGVESLNAATAAAVTLYEASKQRRGPR